MLRVGVVDYGAGNLKSIFNACQASGFAPIIATTMHEIDSSDLIILPGVGSFGKAVSKLKETDLFEAIISSVKSGKPVLGICLGMQLLSSSSNEFGESKGLNLVPGRTRMIDADGERLPNVGWRETKKCAHITSDDTFAPLLPNARYYYVHSFFVQTVNSKHTLSEMIFGDQKIAAVIGYENILGCQFHPEKSAEHGLRFLSSLKLWVKKL